MARRMFLPGRIECPLAGIGVRDSHASNRLVVDDPEIDVSVVGNAITLRDDREHAQARTIADMVWLATSTDRHGRRVPFTIHLELTRTAGTYASDLHTHEPAGMSRERLDYEPFTIVAVHRGDRTTIVDPARLARATARIPLARRLASAATAFRDHDRAPGVVVDRSIGIGALGLGKFLLRARLTEVSAGSASGSGSVAERLRTGSWELSLEALTDRWLPELVQRDTILFGIDGEPLLADIVAGKLRAGQTLAFRFSSDGGELQLDGTRAPLARAHDVAREYLEFHTLGGMIVEALRER